MVDPADMEAHPRSEAAPPPRRRRRRRPFLVAAAAALLWSMGTGLGWFGGGPAEQVGAERQDGARGSAPGPSGGKGLDQQPVAEQLATLRGARQGQPRSAADTGAATAAPDRPERTDVAAKDAAPVGSQPASEPAVRLDADRFESMLSLIDSHIAAEELGEASGVVQRLLAVGLTQRQRSRLVALEGRLRPLNRALEERVLGLLRRGEVLKADRLSQQLLVGETWRPTTLAASLPGRDFGADWQRVPEAELPADLQPVSLARNRKVRIFWRDRVQAGVVANAKADQVTVHVRTDAAQTYPTVPMVRCEPTDSTAGEAVEMGLAAFRAGAPRLARLWLLRAFLLQPEASERGAQLFEVLR